jgi:hypothetical protein
MLVSEGGILRLPPIQLREVGPRKVAALSEPPFEPQKVAFLRISSEVIIQQDMRCNNQSTKKWACTFIQKAYSS